MGDIAIEIKNLTKKYTVNQSLLIVFDDFSASFVKGKITAIIGPSGCGKSTLLRMIAGLEKPTQGEILLRTKDHQIGMIFQEKALFPWLTVEGNIGFGLEFNDIPSELHREIKEYWLEKTGLSKFSKYFPGQISGGMKQKLAMARCLAVKPDIVLMDEPFASLDNQSRFEIIGFFEKLFLAERITVILVTHNIQEAIYLGDNIIGLSNIPVTKPIYHNISLKRPRSIENIKSKMEMDLGKKLTVNNK